MSIAFYIFSPNHAAPSKDTITQALHLKGWHVVFVEGREMKESTARILDYALLYGARSAKLLAQLKDLLRTGDEAAMDGLFENEEAAGCEISVKAPFDAREGYGEDGLEEFPHEVLEQVASGKSHYCIRTSAGRSRTSFDLQEAVWKSVGQLVDGLLEEPQMGEFFRVGPKGLETVYPPEPKEG